MRKAIILLCMLFLLVHCKSETRDESNTNTEQTYSPTLDKPNEKADDDNNDNDNDNDNEEESKPDDKEGISDGTHSATVEYYNSNTGTQSTYNLDVEVWDGKLEKINFENGGYLSSHHFTSGGDFDEDGTTTVTSDEDDNVEYTVTIDD